MGGAVSEELTYEQARAELLAVVEKLEAGGCTLEESLALWERGEQLAGVCERWLAGARARLDQATAASAQTDTPSPPDTTGGRPRRTDG